MQDFGRVNVEHQNVEIPDITVFMSSSLPANERASADQDERRFLICWSSGLQFYKFSFFVHNGTPR